MISRFFLFLHPILQSRGWGRDDPCDKAIYTLVRISDHNCLEDSPDKKFVRRQGRFCNWMESADLFSSFVGDIRTGVGSERNATIVIPPQQKKALLWGGKKTVVPQNVSTHTCLLCLTRKQNSNERMLTSLQSTIDVWLVWHHILEDSRFILVFNLQMM